MIYWSLSEAETPFGCLNDPSKNVETRHCLVSVIMIKIDSIGIVVSVGDKAVPCLYIFGRFSLSVQDFQD